MTSLLVDHIAFLVPSLDRARDALAGPGLSAQPEQRFASEGTRECYLGEPGRPARILLIEAVGEGPYADALARRRPGLHHVGLAVDDLDAFLAEVVDGSGWLVHPRSFATRREAGTVWLARPGVEALVECHEASTEGRGGAAVVERLVIAGLGGRDGLEAIFEGAGVEVVDGARSGVAIGGRFVALPGAEPPEVSGAPESGR